MEENDTLFIDKLGLTRGLIQKQGELAVFMGKYIIKRIRGYIPKEEETKHELFYNCCEVLYELTFMLRYNKIEEFKVKLGKDYDVLINFINDMERGLMDNINHDKLIKSVNVIDKVMFLSGFNNYSKMVDEDEGWEDESVY